MKLLPEAKNNVDLTTSTNLFYGWDYIWKLIQPQMKRHFKGCDWSVCFNSLFHWLKGNNTFYGLNKYFSNQLDSTAKKVDFTF